MLASLLLSIIIIINSNKIENETYDEGKLNKQFMELAQQKIDLSEKLNEIDQKMNVIINKIMSNNSKFSSISEFINLNNLDESNIILEEQSLDSFDE